jgi:hypothetical protein
MSDSNNFILIKGHGHKQTTILLKVELFQMH